MARIVGVDLPKDKPITIGLSTLYGIGRPLAASIVSSLNIPPTTRVKNLTESEVNRLNALIQKEYKVEGDLRREVQGNIRRLIEITAYRGVRHRRNLPVRGQRTRTNARTRRGKRKTVGTIKAAKAKAAGPTAAGDAAGRTKT